MIILKGNWQIVLWRTTGKGVISEPSNLSFFVKLFLKREIWCDGKLIQLLNSD